MKNICFYFQVHQPLRLRRYRFFDIGVNHNYYDDFFNKVSIRRVAEKSYLNMNNILMEMMNIYGDNVKICMSISGITIEQLKWYAPDVLENFQQLVETGNVELISETYNHSFSSLRNKEIFVQQVLKQHKLLEDTFGVTPKVLQNTELLFSDDIARSIVDLPYNACIIEGARHVLGWRSPDYLYCSGANPNLNLITRNYSLSDDISYRFGNTSWDQWPLTADKYLSWINKAFEKGECLTIAVDYENFGEYHDASSGIFDFIKELLRQLVVNDGYKLITPSEILNNHKPASQLFMAYDTTWADEEKDTASWLGNELQEDAFNKLYAAAVAMKKCSNEELSKDYNFLQSSDNFLYMSTKLFSKGSYSRHFVSPYDSPYNAYVNYMNILSDFLIRIESQIR